MHFLIEPLQNAPRGSMSMPGRRNCHKYNIQRGNDLFVAEELSSFPTRSFHHPKFSASVVESAPKINFWYALIDSCTMQCEMLPHKGLSQCSTQAAFRRVHVLWNVSLKFDISGGSTVKKFDLSEVIKWICFRGAFP
jgi:hypothetical protein